MKAIILSAKNPVRRLSLRRGFLLMPLLLVCFGLAPMVQAVGPDIDGAIAGANNGEGIGVLVSRTGGIWNTGTGFEALHHLTAGNQNTATGLRALFSDTNGGFNTATGVLSLFSNTSGFFNTATGAYSLANNTIANFNTANGYAALYYNIEGEQNTATGFAALYRNIDGFGNTANGYQALNRNTTGNFNTAMGNGALFGNTTGFFNTANGAGALQHNTFGFFNTANGIQALFSNTTGEANTANGGLALSSNTTGDSNTANGVGALRNNTAGNFNTAYGVQALLNTTGSGNLAVGVQAGSAVTTVDNVIAIGTGGANVPNSCFIGNIFGATASGGTAVFINSSGQLGTVASSRRFKKEIKPMDSASESILALKPVTFHYRSDASGTPQFGLIAEEVAEANPDLVVRDENGEIYTVRYEAVNAMLLNEFLKEHRKVQEQEATIIQLKKEMETVVARLKEQDSKIQKVSAQLELGKPAPRRVVENR